MTDWRAIQLAEARRNMEHRKPAPDIRTERLLEALAVGGGSVAAGMAPGGGIADAAGYLPGMDGERLPSLYQNLKSGNFVDAGLQGLGAVGDMLYAAGPVGVAVGTAAKAPRAASKAKKVTKSVATVFDDVMDPAVALSRAKKGAHLKTNKAGKYVGAPLEMNMPQKLGKMRREADRLVDVGAPHRMWYDKEREVIADLTDDPVLQKNLARTGALYSSQAKPITEASFAFKAHNNAVLGGDPLMRVRTQEQASNFANAYRDYPTTGTLHPEDIELGPKTNPYSEGKDPTIDMNSLWKTANDIRQGRVYGYGDDFSRGFTAAEHGFLTGENLLLADRANARNPQPQPWNVLRAQASTWVSLDAEKRIAAAVEKATKSGKQLTSSDLARITADAFDEASKGLPAGLDRNSVVMTNEARPGAGVGHLTMGDDEQDLIQRYTDIVLGQTDQRDPVLTSLDMYATRARPAQGTYMNEAGAIERNPGWTHRVGVGTEVTDAGGTRSFPYTSERDEAAINFATDIGAYNRAQEAGANSRFMPEGMGKQNVADMSAVRADLSGAEPQTIDELIRAGISPIDFGGGDTMLMKLGEAQGGRVGPLPAGNFGPLEGVTNDIWGALPPGTSWQRGSVRSNYRPTGLTSPAGSGQATELLLRRAEEASQKVPGIEQRTAPAVANQARLMNEIDDAFARETGKVQREDLRKARSILAEGGVPALRRYVEKYGSAGLPAVVLGMLGLQAAQQPREGGA